MRKFKFALLLIGSALMLTSCVKFTADLEVKKDQTISGNIIFAVSDSLASLAGSGNSLSQGEIIDAKAKGVTVETYNQGGFTGQKYILNNVPFSEFKSKNQDDALSFTKVGNEIRVSGVLDLSDSSNSNDQTTQDMTNAIMAGADIHISIKFPYEVIETSGDLSSDKKTVTWRPKFGEKTKLSATMKIPTFNPLPLVLAFFIGLIAIGFVIRSKRSKSEEAVEPTLNI